MSWANITPPVKTYSGGLSIAADDNAKLYATFSGSAMVSFNSGESWTLVGQVTVKSVSYTISRVHLDPTAPQVLYANLTVEKIEDQAIYANRIAKSYDAGETWQLIDVSPNIPECRNYN